MFGKWEIDKMYKSWERLTAVPVKAESLEPL